MSDPTDRLREAVRNYSDDDLLAAVERRRAWRLARSGKHCPRCGMTKALASFSRDSREVDGVRRYCRVCAAVEYRIRRPGTAHSA